MSKRDTNHTGHELRCVTYDCTPENHDDVRHAIRCITCHCWVDVKPIKDYGCKVTAPGRGHRHTCDQPAGHPLGPEHCCPTCDNWWRPAADGDGVAVLANYEEPAEQGALW